MTYTQGVSNKVFNRIEWTEDELAREENQIIDEYNARFQPLPYRQVFYPPLDGCVDALYLDGYFESAKVILEGIVSGRFFEGIHGVAAVFLSRHSLELALKYTLYHSRWLKDDRTNATEIQPVGKDHHRLQPLWDKLLAELMSRTPSIIGGLDLNFVGEFVKEFHLVDERGMRFRFQGEQLPITTSSRESLGIDFKMLLFNMKRAHDILGTLDNYLIELHGENQEWEYEMGQY